MKYYLFIDECGDQDLSNFDPSFPVFTLCSVLVREDKYKIICDQMQSIKQEFWGDKKIMFHSRDIRKCEKGFEILFNLDVKQKFYRKLNCTLAQSDYYIISCSILKESYIRKYGKMNDVYGLSLSFIMERVVFLLDDFGDDNIELNVIVEKRGKREDKRLLSYYNSLLDNGTYWVESQRIKQYFKSFEMKTKLDNIVGLQIADLVAYPITRYVLDSKHVNMSFDIIKNKIYAKQGKQYGFKVFP